MPVLSYFFAPLRFFPTSSLAQTHTHTQLPYLLWNERTNAGNPFCPTFSRLPYLAKQSCFSRDRPSHAASPPPASWSWCGGPRTRRRTPMAFVFRPRWRLPNAENLASFTEHTCVFRFFFAPSRFHPYFLRCLARPLLHEPHAKRKEGETVFFSFVLVYPGFFVLASFPISDLDWSARVCMNCATVEIFCFCFQETPRKTIARAGVQDPITYPRLVSAHAYGQ